MPQVRLPSIAALSDAIDVPIFIVDIEPGETLRYRKVNRFYEVAAGVSNEDLVGKQPHEVLPPRMAASTTAKYLTCAQSGEPFTYEEVLDLSDGEVWWQTTLTPVSDDDGKVSAIVGTAIDITARKAQEIHDAKMISELKTLNEEVNTYTSMAAHDVRGPLRKIKVISELVFADAQPDSEVQSGSETKPGSKARHAITLAPEQVDLITSIGELAARTLEHVDSILSYARALSLEDQPTLEVLDLGLMLSDLISLVDADERFVFKYSSQTFSAERVIVQIVLRNLLENAVRFGRSACHVEVQASANAADQIQFTVSDDGAGFPDGAVLSEQSAQSRLKSPTNGFGLASAQRIIEQRGGQMWLAPPHFAGGGASVAFSMRGEILT